MGCEGTPLETKYMYVCHAEANAIDNFRGYFNKPGGEYYQDDQFVQLKNIGYRYLKFYRDLDSEAKDDLARGRVR